MFSFQQLSIGLLLAQAESDAPSEYALLGQHLLAAIIFSFVGIAVLLLSIWLMEKMTPFSLVKEIEEDQNVALAVIVGAVVLGISAIIAAAILG